MSTDNNKLHRNHEWGIRSRDQVTVAVITTVAMLAIGASWLYRGGLSGRLIDIDEADPTTVNFQLDVNSADWPEFTLLPGVGETMAKRIVQDRDQHGEFSTPDDLRRVSGIGPRTIERMRPYLLPVAPSADRQGSKPNITDMTNRR